MPGILRIALTFDDGPSSATQASQNPTRRVMDALDSRGIRAAFFIQSHALDENNNPFRGSSEEGRRIIRDLHGDGHIIGIHTGMESQYAHSVVNYHPARLAVEKLYNDLTNARALIEDETGALGEVEFVRPPGGVYTPGVIDKYSDLALQHVHWDIDPERGAAHIPSQIEANIDSQIRDYLDPDKGNREQMVVLLHDIQSAVAYNLIDFIDKIDSVVKEMGYTPNFHLTQEEMKMTLRAQSSQN